MHSASVHIAIFSPTMQNPSGVWRSCLLCFNLTLQLMLQLFPSSMVLVFYGVDPSDGRYAKGKYADAFVQHHRKGRYTERIQGWKRALNSASYLNGFIVEDADLCDEGKLSKLSREIVECAVDKMRKPQLEVAKFPIGLDEAVQDFESKVGSSTVSENVHILGIYGMGGSVKTTLAKELFNRKSSSISRSSFLYDVRHAALAKTLPSLQENLLTDLRIQHSAFHSIEQGKGFLATGLRSMKVLIVLDNMDDADQIDDLLPQRDNLLPRSFIIVTTRDQDVLTNWGISSNYRMKLLDPSNANQLFCRHAFSSPYSQLGFEDLIKKFVDVCDGLPLSLKVLGAMVNGRLKSYWEAQLKKISKMLPDKITDCLRLSYEALEFEERQMFMDIACFFVGEEKSLVIAIWDGSEWSGEPGWESLVNKCLVELNERDCIQMHDHLRDLGRKIAVERIIGEDFSPSRIWKEEQINNLGGITEIRGIVYDGMADCWPTLEHCMEKVRPFLPALKLLAVRGNDFQEFGAVSRQLVWLCWCDFDGTNFPSWLLLTNLTILELHGATNLQELWQDDVEILCSC